MVHTVKMAPFWSLLLLQTIVNEAKDISPYRLFSSSPAQSTLIKWANDVRRNGGSVTHSEASQREKHVVEMVNGGVWSPEIYVEYQKFSARLGNVDSASLLLEYGLGPSLHLLSSEKSSVQRFSQYLLSCSLEKVEKYLRDSPGSENFAFVDGNTPLILATTSGCVTLVRLLLKEGADSSLSGSHGLTPLLVAASMGFWEIVEILARNRPDDLFQHHPFANTSALHLAAEMGHELVLSKLCELGVNASATRTFVGGTALHTAAQVGRWQTIAPLIRTPCSLPVDSLMGGDTTALYLSAQHGHWETVQALLDHGANATFAMPVVATARVARGLTSAPQLTGTLVNSEPANGATALHAAAENGHLEVVRVLLTRGKVSPDLLGEIGVAALHLAAQYSHAPVARLLLAANATVDLRSLVDGSTALYSAVGNGNLEMVETLLRAGASALARRGEQEGEPSPLLYSLSLQNSRITSLLFASVPFCACPADPIATRDCHQSDLALLEATMQSTGSSERSLSTTLRTLDRLLDLFARCGDLFSLRDSLGETLLHRAVASGRAAVLRKVVDRLRLLSSERLSVLTRVRSLSGLTPLHNLFLGLASGEQEEGRVITSLLLEAGSEVNGRILSQQGAGEMELLHGATPLYLACSSKAKGIGEIVDLLLVSGADPNMQLLRGDSTLTPLIAAIDRGTVEVARSLLFGPNSPSSAAVKLANPDPPPSTESSTTSLTQSPLLFAVVRGRADVADLLLTAGARCDLTIMRQQSKSLVALSLLDIARQRRDYDTMQVLSSHQDCITPAEDTLKTTVGDRVRDNL
jgi:ankyrin repeat protein